jgi:hypothetical protein
MTDSQTAFRAVLIAAAPVTALVPAARIYQPWYPETPTFPLITFSETNNYNNDDDYFDNTARSDHMEIEAHAFNLPNTSTYAICAAMDVALKADGWNREYMANLPDPGNYAHRVMRYSKRTPLVLS